MAAQEQSLHGQIVFEAQRIAGMDGDTNPLIELTHSFSLPGEGTFIEAVDGLCNTKGQERIDSIIELVNLSKTADCSTEDGQSVVLWARSILAFEAKREVLSNIEKDPSSLPAQRAYLLSCATTIDLNKLGQTTNPAEMLIDDGQIRTIIENTDIELFVGDFNVEIIGPAIMDSLQVAESLSQNCHTDSDATTEEKNRELGRWFYSMLTGGALSCLYTGRLLEFWQGNYSIDTILKQAQNARIKHTLVSKTKEAMGQESEEIELYQLTSLLQEIASIREQDPELFESVLIEIANTHSQDERNLLVKAAKSHLHQTSHNRTIDGYKNTKEEDERNHTNAIATNAIIARELFEPSVTFLRILPMKREALQLFMYLSDRFPYGDRRNGRIAMVTGYFSGEQLLAITKIIDSRIGEILPRTYKRQLLRFLDELTSYHTRYP